MQKHEIFQFKSINGVDVTAVVIDIMIPEFYQVPESKTWIKKYATIGDRLCEDTNGKWSVLSSEEYKDYCHALHR